MSRVAFPDDPVAKHIEHEYNARIESIYNLSTRTTIYFLITEKTTIIIGRISDVDLMLASPDKHAITIDWKLVKRFLETGTHLLEDKRNVHSS